MENALIKASPTEPVAQALRDLLPGQDQQVVRLNAGIPHLAIPPLHLLLLLGTFSRGSAISLLVVC